MIPILYDELGTEKIGDLNDCLECFVEEERNGIFELTLDYPNDYPLADQLLKEKIIIVNANDTLLNQKFRIYDTKKFINETITVFARHVSFDLMYDYVGDVTFENQSCEYALNSLFRQSQFSTHYRGYSDIVNAQNYSMSMCNILEAIGGKEGSIIDTFGTGAEILRDNTDIHVLNARGHDNGVTIEYGKNLTGFELSEDTTNLVTRILPYAKYTPEGGKETLVKGSFVDSPLIDSYSHPYIKHIDYTDKFKDKEIPTKEKLETLARNEYRDNKVDIPKTNFKIEFVPLSKCVGYEELEDKISICDKVTIKNIRYNVDTKAKVIKYKFDVLKDRYESMELGEPRTTFGNIIGNGGGDGQVGPQGPPGPPGPPGADGNIGDFPNSLPQTPILTTKVYGFATIELSWTFEDKVYYTYELYASKEKDFKPNTFDLIHSGQSSSFLFQAKPNETWYFRVCAKNTHGERTDFSPQVIAVTKKIDDLSNYVDNMAIGEALIGELSLDRGWVGKLNANYLDVKGNFSVTNGNGKRTLDIDSFGDVHFMPRTFKILADGKEEDVITKTQFAQDLNNVKIMASSNKSNMILNSNAFNHLSGWTVDGLEVRTAISHPNEISKGFQLINPFTTERFMYSEYFDLHANTVYRLQVNCNMVQGSVLNGFDAHIIGENNEVYSVLENRGLGFHKAEFVTRENSSGRYRLRIDHNGASQYIGSVIGIDDIYMVRGRYIDNLDWKAASEDNAYLSVESNKIVSEVSGLSDDLGKVKTTVSQQANEIKNKVDAGGAVSAVTQRAGQIISEFSEHGEVQVRNGNFSIANSHGERMLWTNGGRVATSGIDVYGDNDGTLNIFGNGSKGIEIRSHNDQDVYIDLSRNQHEDYHSRMLLTRNHLDLLTQFSAAQYEFTGRGGGITYFNINGNFAVSGSKSRVVKTENYGSRCLNAVESADCYFTDIGESRTINGECKIIIDKVFKETVNTEIDYQVFISKYGKGDIWVEERHSSYFIVKSENDIPFAWEIKAKQKDFEYKRLQMQETEMLKDNGMLWKMYSLKNRK